MQFITTVFKTNYYFRLIADPNQNVDLKSEIKRAPFINAMLLVWL